MHMPGIYPVFFYAPHRIAAASHVPLNSQKYTNVIYFIPHQFNSINLTQSRGIFHLYSTYFSQFYFSLEPQLVSIYWAQGALSAGGVVWCELAGVPEIPGQHGPKSAKNTPLGSGGREMPGPG